MSLPQWTTRITNTEVGGEDHLGLEGAAQSYQQLLVPGIITTTDHARYYSFYSWILHRFIFDPASTRRIADFRGSLLSASRSGLHSGLLQPPQARFILTWACRRGQQQLQGPPDLAKW